VKQAKNTFRRWVQALQRKPAVKPQRPGAPAELDAKQVATVAGGVGSDTAASPKGGGW
jgi:transposase